MNQPAREPNSGSDLWVAFGVVIVLGGLAFGIGGLYREAEPAYVDASTLRGAALDGSDAGRAPSDATKSPTESAGPAPVKAPEPDGHKAVTFDELAGFLYEDPNLSSGLLSATDFGDKKTAQIPATILELNGKRVVVQGFMYPIKVEKGAVVAFWLLRNQTLCCFGQFPRLNELVFVTLPEGKSTQWLNDQVVTVWGRLEVGEQKNKDGYVTSIYRMAAEKVEGPLDL
ncbi:MAG: DUF3299 domain-containing protein [Planctomycetota bacterium]|nr:DUF3299 domain-containing protein [Planctomycetota bacterium]